MSVLSLLTFTPPILTGALIVHLLWADRKGPLDLILQLSLGAGLGLGISCLLYYAYLTFFAGRPWFLYVELAFFLTALVVTYLKHKKTASTSAPPLNNTAPAAVPGGGDTIRSKSGFAINFLQVAILAIALFTSAVSFLGLVNYSRQRAHGDWDAWMIYNRSALFIHRGGETWRDAFSSDMDLVFHADYPPLLALNIAARWEMLDAETTFVPMILGFLFILASLGLCFGALANLKSVGQGALGLIFLGGVSFFFSEGGRQTADVPFAFFVLGSAVFLFFHDREKRWIFMAFAGFMAGLSAWTKNEGSLFVFASVGVLFLTALWKRSFRDFLFYLAGLSLPLILLLHFKFQVAPSSEFADGGIAVILQKMTDAARHELIFNSFKKFFLRSGGWLGMGIYIILGVYALLFRTRSRNNSAAFTVLAILAFQYLGYYVFYMISPYDLNWHIGYSLKRLFVHAYPAVVFMALVASQTPETVFSSNPE